MSILNNYLRFCKIKTPIKSNVVSDIDSSYEVITKPHNFLSEKNISYLNNSNNKYNKLIETNENIKRKNIFKKILNENTIIKTTNHSVNDLINISKLNNLFFIISFVSIGALIFYKNK